MNVSATDAECVGSYERDNSNAAFSLLVERHSGWIFAAAKRRLHDEHLAEDATQAVFMLLMDKAAGIVESEQTSIAAWLFHAMHLTCSRLRRSRARAEQRDRNSPTPAHDEMPQDDLRVLLEDSIAQLPHLDRQAIVRRFYQRQDYQSIGREFQCSADAIRKRISRSLVIVRELMLKDGIDVIPDELLNSIPEERHAGGMRSISENARIEKLVRGASTMMQQAEATDFTIWSAEFRVTDVEANLDFFEKLGFQRHFIDPPDAMGRVPRASLRGGKTSRIWLRRASDAEGTRPTPGATLFFWIEGGADALVARRDAIAAQGAQPSAFFDDVSLRNFTVTSPDGYRVGFFTAYR